MYTSAHEKCDRFGEAVAWVACLLPRDAEVLAGDGCGRIGVDRCFLLAEVAAVLFQPIPEDRDARNEVVTKQHQQVDIVRVLAATKTMCQVVLRIHRRAKFVTVRTLKSKIAFELFRSRTMMAQPSQRQLHR